MTLDSPCPLLDPLSAPPPTTMVLTTKLEKTKPPEPFSLSRSIYTEILHIELDALSWACLPLSCFALCVWEMPPGPLLTHPATCLSSAQIEEHSRRTYLRPIPARHWGQGSHPTNQFALCHPSLVRQAGLCPSAIDFFWLQAWA